MENQLTYIDHKSDNRYSKFQKDLKKFVNGILKNNNIQTEGNLDFIKNDFKGSIEIPEGTIYMNPYVMYGSPITSIKFPSSLVFGATTANPVDHIILPQNIKGFIVNETPCKYIIIEGYNTHLLSLNIDYILKNVNLMKIEMLSGIDLNLLSQEELDAYNYMQTEEFKSKRSALTDILCTQFKIFVPDDAVDSYKQMDGTNKN